MESLRRLDRPPGADTGAVADSLAVTAFQVSGRPGQAQVLSATDSVMAAILGRAAMSLGPEGERVQG